MQDKLEVCIKDWAELADEYKELELRHKEYRAESVFDSAGYVCRIHALPVALRVIGLLFALTSLVVSEPSFYGSLSS